MDLGGSQSKFKCPYPVKCHNFQVISLGKLGSFTLISTELSLIFSAGSGHFGQEEEALKEHCFRFQPSSVKCQNVQVISLGILSSFMFFSTELPFIFSAGSGPFWQEVEALKKYCFRFKPSSVKYQNFQVISLGKLSSYKFFSTELPLIFSAGSRPFWEEVEALKQYCFCFQPSDIGWGHFSRVGTLP